MSNKKRIMILGASVLQLPAIKKAIEMGLEVIVVDKNPLAVGFEVPGVIKEVISTIDIPAVLEAAKRHSIDGIMTLATDMPVRTVAVVSRVMGLVGVSEDTALKTTNKSIMRRALKDNNVPIPMFFSAHGKEEFIKKINEIRSRGYKCIVKPADNSGSRGVTLLEENDDLNVAYDYTVNNSRSGDIIVEEYMEGPEVSVETLAVKGEIHVIQITDKVTTGAPYFVEMGHSQPSILSEDTKNKIRQVAIAANKAVGIEEGPSHTEIIITKDGPKIVELGARLGGDCITTHLVPLSTGVDMIECCIKISLGISPDYYPKWRKGSAIRYIQTDSGEVKDIKGIKEAESIEGVVEVVILKGVGQHVERIKSSTDRTGFVISQAENVKTAILTSEAARDKIEYIVIPEEQ